MWLLGDLAVDGLVDGVVTAHYETSLTIGGHSEALSMGPHTFQVALNRDWKTERSRYLELLEA